MLLNLKPRHLFRLQHFLACADVTLVPVAAERAINSTVPLSERGAHLLVRNSLGPKSIF